MAAGCLKCSIIQAADFLTGMFARSGPGPEGGPGFPSRLWQLAQFSLRKYPMPASSCGESPIQSVGALKSMATVLSGLGVVAMADRKSTRLNSSHLGISYAGFFL